MSNSLVEFCASTAALESSVASQQFQNISSLLESEADLIFFISFIPQFQKTVRKAAWKSCQKKIKENGNETRLIEAAFKAQKTEALKKDFAYFISSFSDPKCLLGPATFAWLVARTGAALESFSDLQDLATLTKILNSTIKVLSADQLSSISSVIPFMKHALQRSELHLQIELCASFAVSIVNFAIVSEFSPDEFFEFLDVEKKENTVYKLFIIRALVSCLPQESLLMDFGSWKMCDYLIAELIDISLKTSLQPTQICYAVRGLTESVEFFQRKKILLAEEIYSLLQKSGFLTKMSEHPLDVVRVNSWKLIKIVANHKLAALKDSEELKSKMRSEIQAIVSNGFATRSETIWLTNLIEPTVLSFTKLDFPKIARKALENGKEQSMSPLSGALLGKCFESSASETLDAIMSVFPKICREYDPNSRRLFFDVILPKMLLTKNLGDAFLAFCKKAKTPETTQLIISILQLQKRAFSDDLIAAEDLKEMLSSKSIDSRLNTLGYITSTRKTALPFSALSLELVKLSISSNLNLQRPAHRQLLNSILSRVFARFDASFVYSKSPADYFQFIDFLARLCETELVPGASSARNNLILTYLDYLMGFKNQSLRDHVTKVLSNNLASISASLKFLLFNSFQEVAKNAQQTLLKLVDACDSPVSSNTASSIDLLRKSKVLSDSAGLVYLLIFELESQARKEKIPKDKLAGNWVLEICEKLEEDLENGDLASCATSKPHYGLLAGLEALLPFLRDAHPQMKATLINTLFKICAKANDFAIPVVNASSPEGFLPESDVSKDFDSFKLDGRRIAADSTELAQLLLVMCWRITKSVSMLMGSMCAVLDADINFYKKCMEYFVKQLTQGRHRGAFELAATGFTELCQEVRRRSAKEAGFSNLLDEWLDECLAILKDEEKVKRLCNTRRSAGLPFMFVAICSADVGRRSKPLLTKTMMEIFPLAEDLSDEEVACHARNILRALFRESNFGENVLQYAEKAMVMSIAGFADKTWALRNTSAMMYSTLSSRIFGVKKTDDEQKISSSEFFSRFPVLQKALMDNLESAAKKVNSSSLPPTLLPSLIIIQRLFPTSTGSTEVNFIPSLIQLSGTKVWKGRQIAARCFASLNNRPLSTFEEEFLEILASRNENRIHGLLLLITGDKEALKTLSPTVLRAILERAAQFSIPSQSIVVKLAMMLNEENILTLAEILILSKSKNIDLAELNFYENAARFSVRLGSEKIMLHLLKMRGNAARALVAEKCFWSDETFKTETIKDELVEMLIKSECDETRIGCARALLSGKIEDDVRICKLRTLAGEIRMDLVKNSELTGLVLELLLKIGEEKAVARHLSEASKPHQHWILRRSAALCCVEIVFGNNKKTVPPEVSECLLRCWVDEDGDVREPVVERLGDIPFIDGRSPFMDLWLEKVERGKALEILARIGFRNESEAFSLFQERATAFDVVNLNQNFEPILMTRLALYGIKKLAATDDVETIRAISTDLTTLLKEISHQKEKQTEVTKLQFRLLSDFIADL